MSTVELSDDQAELLGDVQTEVYGPTVGYADVIASMCREKLGLDDDGGVRDVRVGDIVRVVILDSNEDEDRDPFTRIDGRPTFVRTNGHDVEFGETIRAKVADVKEGGAIVAVAAEEADG